MAKNTNPFGMIKSDINKLDKLVANARPSLDVNFTQRISPGNFRCGSAAATKKSTRMSLGLVVIIFVMGV